MFRAKDQIYLFEVLEFPVGYPIFFKNKKYNTIFKYVVFFSLPCNNQF